VKLGELLKMMPKATGAPGPGRGKTGARAELVSDRPTYADYGIDKKARRLEAAAGVKVPRGHRYRDEEKSVPRRDRLLRTRRVWFSSGTALKTGRKGGPVFDPTLGVP
jgi:hypothetical protein